MIRIAVCIPSATLLFAACDDDDAPTSADERPGPAESLDVPDEPPDLDVGEPPEAESPTAPTSPDQELIEAYVDEHGEHPTTDADRGSRGEVASEVLDDFDLRVSGSGTDGRQNRVFFDVDDLSEASDDRVLEVCEAVSEYFATDAAEDAADGPLLLVLADGEEADDEGFLSPNVVVYNDRIVVAEDPGRCALL